MPDAQSLALGCKPHEVGELSRFVGWLTLTYTQRWHAHYKHEGSGHLYQGRFKSFPIQDENYFLTVCHYVECNALRANVVAKAQHGAEAVCGVASRRCGSKMTAGSMANSQFTEMASLSMHHRLKRNCRCYNEASPEDVCLVMKTGQIGWLSVWDLSVHYDHRTGQRRKTVPDTVSPSGDDCAFNYMRGSHIFFFKAVSTNTPGLAPGMIVLSTTRAIPTYFFSRRSARIPQGLEIVQL